MMAVEHMNLGELRAWIDSLWHGAMFHERPLMRAHFCERISEAISELHRREISHTKQ